jgi:acetate kinase
MNRQVMTVNAGSSSLKTAIYEETGEAPRAVFKAEVTGIPETMRVVAVDAEGKQVRDEALEAGDAPHQRALAAVYGPLMAAVDTDRLAAISHRVVHGGTRFAEAIIVDDEALDAIEALSPFAPSHQPHNVYPIRYFAEHLPNTPQIACFDTSFHTTQPWFAKTFALPREMTEAGVVRYGFHGLSYAYILEALPKYVGDLALENVIVGHLGHGVSMSAIQEGRSIATTMGLTAVDGLPMGQRSGSVDPGAVIHLMEEMGYSLKDTKEILYKKSGLLGLSGGLSHDMQTLLQSDDPRAKEAVEVFVYRCRRAIGSLAAALQGLDVLVFTGGIGENAAPIRERICAGLGWLGAHLDRDANKVGGPDLTAGDSRVRILTLKTDEARMLATEALRLTATV